MPTMTSLGASSADEETAVNVVVEGATATSDGARGLVPAPKISDRNKALFGDGRWHNIYSGNQDSTVVVTADSDTLEGQTVTITDGRRTYTGVISEGEAVIENVLLAGGVTASAPTTDGNTAVGAITMSYFGQYILPLVPDYCKVVMTTESSALKGKTMDVILSGEKVGEAAFDATGTATYFAQEVGTYTFKMDDDGSRMLQRVVVGDLAGRTVTVSGIIPYVVYAYEITDATVSALSNVAPYDSEYGCDNMDFTPAYMDFTKGEFNWGSWKAENPFFLPKPCVLGYDGTVLYYLDPDDYTKKADGTASDISDATVPGNVMMEFPAIYFKRWQENGKTRCVISNQPLDQDFHSYAHHDVNGNILPYIYLAAYEGSVVDGKMRSISGRAPTVNATRQQEVTYAKANNVEGDSGERWYTRHKADRDMVNDLLVLLSMSANTQAKFGTGNQSGYVSPSSTGVIASGSMDARGLFWGDQSTKTGVKVFGIEHWWGNIWKADAGMVNANGQQKTKMCYGVEDGSTVEGFNFDGSGYYPIASATPTGTAGGYTKAWKYSEHGMVPYAIQGSNAENATYAQQYLADGFWYKNSQNSYLFSGGNSNNGSRVGAFSACLNYAPSYAYWGIGASLSYKGKVAVSS